MERKSATNSAIAWIRDTRSSLSFHVRKPVWEDVLQDELPFGAQGSARFCELVESSASYLEYGAGSSTFTAARVVHRLATIESDPRFLSAVKRKCSFVTRGDSSAHVFVHGDIGKTGPWGKPILPFVKRPERWRNYPRAPWEKIGPSYSADLILVDGRFRVACALAQILYQPHSTWTLLVDDYLGRPEYEIIATFMRMVGVHGRMAEFKPIDGCPRELVQQAFEAACSDWR